MTAACRTTAPELAALQRWFFGQVTRQRVPGAPSRASAASSTESLIAPGGLSAAARIDVYRHAYVARLIECLADDYPAVADALGPAAFERMGRAFIKAHPPASASLNFFGAAFADFCGLRGGTSKPFLRDLARLEWAVVRAIHADAETVLDAAALGALAEGDWARLRLVPSPALFLVRADYAVHGYYRAFLEGEHPAPPAPEPSAIAVCRRGDDVWRLALGARLADLLARLLEGDRLTAALDAFASDGTSADEDATVQQALQQWVACGFFCGVVLG